ncbi:DUF4339 domain-containing protein [Shewanella sp. JM162201]|uniref:DUF4339 domain-containing protein n=1 Tax=Shewanella jiangmenensis TaxID=2837387 RepID=A0ABS5V155_9GAMM|nr:DUF4339 domain-containing protein [Shewanella jiangmenensis]MBT1443537.1 DUF4339 domain-containing protein [Shewanella jiangmenensis]
MTQWYFSHKGEVTGPLALAESNQFIAENPDTYAWHPGFAQWVPVSQIDEFEHPMSPPPPPGAIPAKLLAQFSEKEQELYQSLGKLDDSLTTLEAAIAALDQDINNSKADTQSLNQEVNATLRSINEQYEALQKRVAGLAGKQSPRDNT